MMLVEKTRLFAVIKKSSPFIFLFLGIIFAWRTGNWFKYIPAYGDVLEIAWGSEWYLSKLSDPSSAFHYPTIYYPRGWDVRTFPQGLGVFLITVPLAAIGGAAFAINLSGILAICTAFGGVYFLLRPHVDRLSASTGAFLFAFWEFRYLAHLHIFLGTALIPWIILFLEKGCAKQKRRWVWFVVAGVIWGLAANMSLYFIWLGAIAALLWLLGKRLAQKISWRDSFTFALITIATFMIFALPGIVLFWQSESTGTGSFDIYQLDLWGASLNSLFIPSPNHPILRPLSRTIYSGVLGETGLSNLGLFTAIAVFIGFWRISDKRRLTPIFLLIICGLVLGLGPFLKWNHKPFNVAWLHTFNEIVWGLAYRLKPTLFVVPGPMPGFENAILLPEFFIAALVPFWEGVRTVSRFVLVGGLGFFLLVSLSINSIEKRWLKIFLIILILFEALSAPFSNRGVPLETELHLAYQWLRDQEPQDTVIIDLSAVGPGEVTVMQEAGIMWAADEHGKYTVSGMGSVWPAHTLFLQNWLNENQITTASSTAGALLASFDVRYVFLHMTNNHAQQIFADLGNSESFAVVGCFNPGQEVSPWQYQICVLQNNVFTQGAGKPQFFKNGWGGVEPWGIWGTDEGSRFDWVATERRDHQLSFEAAPYCVEGSLQELDLFLNGEPINHHKWSDCEVVQFSLRLPESELELGWNNLIFKYGYAAKPNLITSGVNNDQRNLALAFRNIDIR